MISSRRPARLGLLAPILAAALIVGGVPAAAAASPSGFASPFTIAAPVAADLEPVQLAFAPGNAIAAAFGITDEDAGSSASARLAFQSAGRRFAAPRTIDAAQQVLALAYQGSKLELLTGNSPAGLQCCSAVLAAPVTGSRIGARHTIIAGLAGTTEAALISTTGRLLAAVASEHGLWVAQSDTRGRFGTTRNLDVRRGLPQAVAATALPHGKTIVVWTARASQFATGPSGVYLAAGDSSGAPSHPHVTIQVQATHTIDELTLATRDHVPTVAWIESWYDATGKFHSQAYAEDLTQTRVPQLLSPASELASGLVLAGAGSSELVAFRGCTLDGQCQLRASLRRSGRFAAAASFGEADGTQTPAVAVGRTGAALVAWVRNGGVAAAVASQRGARLGPAVTVSQTGFASDPALSFAAAGDAALAAWTQGTVNQSIVGARYTVG
ncbi:MAG: hypothetical protein ACYDHH_20755 [Solirubrobacteraceae bacterium]